MPTVSEVNSLTTHRFNKLQPVEIIERQSVTVAPRVVILDSLDTTNIQSVSVVIQMGRETENAFSAGINFRIEMSPVTSRNDWYIVTQFTSALGSSVASQAINGACLAGTKTIPMTDTTGFAVGDYIFIMNTTITNSEFARITAVNTNVSVTIEDSLVITQTGSTVYNQSESYYALIDCSAIKKLRVVVDGSGTGQNFFVHCDSCLGA